MPMWTYIDLVVKDKKNYKKHGMYYDTYFNNKLMYNKPGGCKLSHPPIVSSTLKIWYNESSLRSSHSSRRGFKHCDIAFPSVL